MSTPTDDPRTWIIAENYQQFRRYVRMQNMPVKHTKYICGPDLRGLDRPRVLLIGTFPFRPDWLEMTEGLSLCRAQVREDRF